ncbi:hypothetical protein N9A28_09855 [Sulfurimonas sp.]|nr:hypothetical protein [Sulfurimonas sp.]
MYRSIKLVLLALTIGLLCSGCTIREAQSLSPIEVNNHLAVYKANYDFECSSSERATVSYSVKSGNIFAPVVLGGVMFAKHSLIIPMMMNNGVVLPKHTIGLLIYDERAVLLDGEQHYMLINPDGNLASDNAIGSLVQAQINFKGLENYGYNCSIREDEAPFKLIENN